MSVRRKAVRILVLAAVVGAATACGAGPAALTTPPGTYQITVTGAYQNISASVRLQLIVR